MLTVSISLAVCLKLTLKRNQNPSTQWMFHICNVYIRDETTSVLLCSALHGTAENLIPATDHAGLCTPPHEDNGLTLGYTDSNLDPKAVADKNQRI